MTVLPFCWVVVILALFYTIPCFAAERESEDAITARLVAAERRAGYWGGDWQEYQIRQRVRAMLTPAEGVERARNIEFGAPRIYREAPAHRGSIYQPAVGRAETTTNTYFRSWAREANLEYNQLSEDDYRLGLMELPKERPLLLALSVAELKMVLTDRFKHDQNGESSTETLDQCGSGILPPATQKAIAIWTARQKAILNQGNDLLGRLDILRDRSGAALSRMRVILVRLGRRANDPLLADLETNRDALLEREARIVRGTALLVGRLQTRIRELDESIDRLIRTEIKAMEKEKEELRKVYANYTELMRDMSATRQELSNLLRTITAGDIHSAIISDNRRFLDWLGHVQRGIETKTLSGNLAAAEKIHDSGNVRLLYGIGAARAQTNSRVQFENQIARIRGFMRSVQQDHPESPWIAWSEEELRAVECKIRRTAGANREI